MEFNFLFIALAALVPLVMGYIWYGPLFGNVWMKEMGFTKESLKGSNMALIFILSYVFSFMISLFLVFIVVHQMGVMQVLQGEVGMAEKTGDAWLYFQDFLANYGNRFRTFGHGAIHGVGTGILFVLPILGTIAMFEKKSVKYVAINAGYWIVTLALMGGIICQFGVA